MRIIATTTTCILLITLLSAGSGAALAGDKAEAGTSKIG
jgi:hypothetical protein